MGRPRAYSSQHALGTTWPWGGPGPTAPSMPREQPGHGAAPGLQLPACPGNNLAMGQVPSLQLPACPGEQPGHGAVPSLQLPACPGNNLAMGWPRAYSSQHAPGTTWPWGGPGPTAPSMPREQPGHGAAPGLQLPACPGNNLAMGWPWAYSSQHALGHAFSQQAMGHPCPAVGPWGDTSPQPQPCRPHGPFPGLPKHRPRPRNPGGAGSRGREAPSCRE